MSDDSEMWGTLRGDNVTLLERWESAGNDLLQADMALLARRELKMELATIFHKRALWESAVVSYGRTVMSDHERKIPFKDYVEEIAGADGLAVHERVMDWRHGHVAHRKRPEFESVETVVTYVNGSDAPSALHLVLGIDLGPEDEGEFVTSFRQLVEVLRTSLYERRILPLVMKIVDDLNAGTIPFPLSSRPADDQSSPERYVFNRHLVDVNVTQRLAD